MRRLGTVARLLSLVPLGLGTLGLALGAIAPARAADGAGEAWVLPTTGVVDGVMAGYLADGVAKAAREGAEVVVVKLNTPGGSLEATQKITGVFLEAPLPVIVWVAPAGGRAASAGTFITLSAHLAWMAPGTNIGAASPISSSGEDIGGTLGEKVKNDAIANITAIAQARGRPVDWAVSTVSEAKSYSAVGGGRRGRRRRDRLDDRGGPRRGGRAHGHRRRGARGHPRDGRRRPRSRSR